MVSKQDWNGSAAGSATGHTGDEIQRWTALRTAAVVIDIMKGKTQRPSREFARLEHRLAGVDGSSWGR